LDKENTIFACLNPEVKALPPKAISLTFTYLQCNSIILFPFAGIVL
jgi:hypothetical protein